MPVDNDPLEHVRDSRDDEDATFAAMRRTLNAPALTFDLAQSPRSPYIGQSAGSEAVYSPNYHKIIGWRPLGKKRGRPMLSMLIEQEIKEEERQLALAYRPFPKRYAGRKSGESRQQLRTFVVALEKKLSAQSVKKNHRAKKIWHAATNAGFNCSLRSIQAHRASIKIKAQRTE